MILFGSQIGYHLYYAFQQHQIRAEMKRQMVAELPDAALKAVVANENNSFTWQEEGKEFYQDGMLYDVVKSAIIDGKTILYCINDKQEEDLLFQMHKTTKSGGNKRVLQILKKQIIDNLVAVIETTANSNPIPKQKYLSFKAAISVQCKEVYAPPPQA